MSKTMLESVARAICYRAVKISLDDEGNVLRKGCPRDLNCRENGSCEEHFNLLRCSIYWQTARAAVEALREVDAKIFETVFREVLIARGFVSPDGLTVTAPLAKICELAVLSFYFSGEDDDEPSEADSILSEKA